ncbi:MAG: Wzz/FepE/Etk N-terminal domain-containing protein [Agathobacter sp.]|nr:Wzz/FepE/Etk N-terminal domain-containing protein [Agathobacter sp.]
MRFKNEIEIDVGRCIRALAHKKLLIFIISILFAVIGFAMTLEEQEDQYTATATVYSVYSGSYAESKTGTSAMNDYVDVATSHKVCQRAAYMLGRQGIDAETVKNAITVVENEKPSSGSSAAYLQNDSTIIVITAKTNDANISMEMADAVAESFVLEMENIIGTDSVQILDEAYDYEVASRGEVVKWKTRFLATAFGFILSCCMVVFFEIFDGYTRTVREASIRGQLPVIGVIPDYK